MGQSNLKKSVALFALATLGSLGIAQSAHADVTTKWNGSPETREDDRRFHVSGRFMYDIAYTDADYSTAAGASAEDGFHSYARRAFIGVDGRLSEHWRYNAKLDLGFGASSTNADGTVKASGNSSSSIKADDFYLEYAADWGSVFFGNSNAVSPMEDRDSSLNIPFNERSFLITALGFGKRPGVAFLTNGGNWSAGVAVQSNSGLEAADNAYVGSESGFAIARVTYAPIFQQTPEGTTVLHLGLTGRYRDDGSQNGTITGTSSLSYTPGSLSNKAGLDAKVDKFGQDVFYGAEVAFQHNAFGAEAEYGHFDVTDGAANGASGDGYYVDLFWSPTGESRNYKAADGSFGAVSPLRPMGSGGIGHVMLAARYEDLDLSDTQFGGAGLQNENETTAYTLGASWVPIEHVKFQLNYSHTEIDYVKPANVDNNMNAVTLRTQFDW